MDWLIQPLISVFLTCIVGFIAYLRLKSTIYQAIDDFGGQLAETVKEIFSPTVKKGFSLAGSLGGKAKATQELKNRMAKGFIQKNMGLVKLLAEQFMGIDVEELIDEYGADTILQAAKELGVFAKGSGVQGFNLQGILGNNGSRGNEVPQM